MAKLVWDQSGQKFFETGVSNGVLYVSDGQGGYLKGVAWNGLTSVAENPSGAESNPVYADNIKYLNIISAEEFGATIEAYTYPDEFMECDGSAQVVAGVNIGQQARKSFGISYRTRVGNDVAGDNLGYKIHVIYNCQAAPSGKTYSTVNESPEAITFSWEVTTTPVPVEGFRPTATVVFDSTKLDAEKMAAVENALYGGASSEPGLPSIEELLALVQ
jgi:hypothetical protein